LQASKIKDAEKKIKKNSEEKNASQVEKKGETEIQLIVRQKDTKFTVKLENPRKFDLKLFNEVKNREYVKKITF